MRAHYQGGPSLLRGQLCSFLRSGLGAEFLYVKTTKTRIKRQWGIFQGYLETLKPTLDLNLKLMPFSKDEVDPAP